MLLSCPRAGQPGELWGAAPGVVLPEAVHSPGAVESSTRHGPPKSLGLTGGDAAEGLGLRVKPSLRRGKETMSNARKRRNTVENET